MSSSAFNEFSPEKAFQRVDYLQKLETFIPGVLYAYHSLTDGQPLGFPYLSENFEDLVGISRETAQENPESVYGKINPEDLEGLLQEAKRSLATGQPLKADFRFMTPHKREVWLEGRSKSELQDDGTVIWYGHFDDITEQKKKDLSIFSSEERLREIFEHTEFLAVQGFNADREIIYWNQASEKLYGYLKEEAIGRKLDDLIIPDALREDIRQAFRRFLVEGEDLEPSEMTLKRADGQPVHVFSNHLLLSNPETGEKEMFCLDVDVTRLREAEEELKQTNLELEKKNRAARNLARKAAAANSAKSEFLASMSHEIRTPLNAIIGLVELLLETELSENQQDTLRKVMISSRLLLGVVNEILDLTRIESDELVLEIQPFAPADVFRQIHNVFGHLSESKGLKLKTSMDAKIPTRVMGDPFRLGQILNNLVSNAVKFTFEGEVVLSAEVVAAETESTRIRFTVEDTGIGMTKEQVSGIFSPFHQADSSIGRRFGGSGLGLRISQKLVETMGGELKVESMPGEGSVFSFELSFPKVLEESPPEVQSFSDRKIPNLSDRRILLVEDNVINQEVGVRWIQKTGAAVEVAENGEIALRMLQRKSFDLVFMDLEMPVMDGIETTFSLRNHFPRLPVIGISAAAFTTDRERSLAAGMNDYLSKPIESKKLFALLDKWLGSK